MQPKFKKDKSQMKPLAEIVFMGEIVMQSKIAERAAERLSPNSEHNDSLEVWCSIQLILIAAGNVSKILWPQRKKYITRGEKLRKLLQVDDDNLLSDRKFRNHFEHYDERIEDWFEKNSSVVYIDKKIDPFKSFWGENINTAHRTYNPLTMTLNFRGEVLDLGSILSALKEIRHNCRHFVLT